MANANKPNELFITIPHSLFFDSNLTLEEKVIYWYIKDRLRVFRITNKSALFSESCKTIAAYNNTNQQKAAKVLKGLELKGYLIRKREKIGHPVEYDITSPPAPAVAPPVTPIAPPEYDYEWDVEDEDGLPF